MEFGILFSGIAVLLLIVAGLSLAPTFFPQKRVEALYCASEIAVVKATIEKALITKVIKCEGVERYWGPAKTLSENEAGVVLLSTIYYERVVHYDDGGIGRVTENITLTVKLGKKDSGTAVEFSFDQSESMFTCSQAQQIMTDTRASLSQVLTNLELGHWH